MIFAEIVEEQEGSSARGRCRATSWIFRVKQIYRMAAKGQIPSLKISNSVRFDPHDVAVWLRSQSSTNPSGSFVTEPHLSEER